MRMKTKLKCAIWSSNCLTIRVCSTSCHLICGTIRVNSLHFFDFRLFLRQWDHLLSSFGRIPARGALHGVIATARIILVIAIARGVAVEDLSAHEAKVLVRVQAERGIQQAHHEEWVREKFVELHGRHIWRRRRLFDAAASKWSRSAWVSYLSFFLFFHHFSCQ